METKEALEFLKDFAPRHPTHPIAVRTVRKALAAAQRVVMEPSNCTMAPQQAAACLAACAFKLTERQREAVRVLTNAAVVDTSDWEDGYRPFKMAKIPNAGKQIDALKHSVFIPNRKSTRGEE